MYYEMKTDTCGTIHKLYNIEHSVHGLAQSADVKCSTVYSQAAKSLSFYGIFSTVLPRTI